MVASRGRGEISTLAHNRTQRYLGHHDLTEDEREQFTEVVLGYLGLCDVSAARRIRPVTPALLAS